MKDTIHDIQKQLGRLTCDTTKAWAYAVVDGDRDKAKQIYALKHALHRAADTLHEAYDIANTLGDNI